MAERLEARSLAVQHPQPASWQAMRARDEDEARQYGAIAAGQIEWLGRAWDEVAPPLAAGWEQRHTQVCRPQHDWRLSWPAVRQGWKEAQGAR